MRIALIIILLPLITSLSSLGAQMVYFELLGLTGLDSKFPKFTNWIQNSGSIFAKPLGLCAVCNFFWFYFLFSVIFASYFYSVGDSFAMYYTAFPLLLKFIQTFLQTNKQPS